MRLFTVFACGLLGGLGFLFTGGGGAGPRALASPGPDAAESAVCHYDLWFKPQQKKELIVQLEDVETRRGPAENKTEFSAKIAWTFRKDGRRNWEASGRCLEAKLVKTVGKGKAARRQELVFTRSQGLAPRVAPTKEQRQFAEDMAAPFSARLDHCGRVRVNDGQEILFGRGTLVRSARLGFGVLLSGKATVPSGTWTEQGDLFGVAGADRLSNRFRIDRVTREGKTRVARLEGKVLRGLPAAWTKKDASCTQTATFALSEKYLMKSEIKVGSPALNRRIATQASWRKQQEEPARLAALRR